MLNGGNTHAPRLGILIHHSAFIIQHSSSMNLTPEFIPLKAPVHRKRRSLSSPAPAPPAALTLVSATYDSTQSTLTLAFDRAIEIGGVDGFDGAAISVSDGDIQGLLYDGQGAGGAVLEN